MEFFGFILIHTVAKEDSEKCQSIEGLKEVKLTNVANFIVEDPITIEHFIKSGGANHIFVEYANKGLDFFIECLTLRCKEGSKILKESEYTNRPISELIGKGVVALADHDANVVVLP